MTTTLQSSFPIIHKVDKAGIFKQLLMEINWEWLPAEYIFTAHTVVWEGNVFSISVCLHGGRVP